MTWFGSGTVAWFVRGCVDRICHKFYSAFRKVVMHHFERKISGGHPANSAASRSIATSAKT